MSRMANKNSDVQYIRDKLAQVEFALANRTPSTSVTPFRCIRGTYTDERSVSPSVYVDDVLTVLFDCLPAGYWIRSFEDPVRHTSDNAGLAALGIDRDRLLGLAGLRTHCNEVWANLKTIIDSIGLVYLQGRTLEGTVWQGASEFGGVNGARDAVVAVGTDVYAYRLVYWDGIGNTKCSQDYCDSSHDVALGWSSVGDVLWHVYFSGYAKPPVPVVDFPDYPDSITGLVRFSSSADGDFLYGLNASLPDNDFWFTGPSPQNFGRSAVGVSLSDIQSSPLYDEEGTKVHTWILGSPHTYFSIL